MRIEWAIIATVLADTAPEVSAEHTLCVARVVIGAGGDRGAGHDSDRSQPLAQHLQPPTLAYTALTQHDLLLSAPMVFAQNRKVHTVPPVEITSGYS